MDTYYNPIPHFGYDLALAHSPIVSGCSDALLPALPLHCLACCCALPAACLPACTDYFIGRPSSPELCPPRAAAAGCADAAEGQ
jgi:hypothetical protein